MITKTQFANIIIEDFCNENGIGRNELNSGHIFQSSRLAVAMEFLGMLNDSEQQYSSGRGGTEYRCIEVEDNQYVDLHILSIRKMFDLIPE